MRKLAVLAAAAVLSAAGVGSVFASSAAHSARPGITHALLSIINHDRSDHGLQPLRLGGRLDRAALGHSLDMARHGYFSHTGLDGSSPFQRLARAGVAYNLAGENLGYDSGAGKLSMLRAIDRAMLRSPDHRANLLQPAYRRVGIGIAVQGNTMYVTEDFTG